MDDDVHDKDEEIDDLEADLGAAAPEAGEDGGRMIAVEDFLSALESALESALGDEVEIDASDMDVEDEVEADVELDAADDMELDTDMEMDDEMLAEEEELEEGGMDAGDQSATRRDFPHAKQSEKAKKRRRQYAKTHKGHGQSTGDQGGADFSESTEATDDLVEQITKRVAARILKSALAKK